MENEQEQIKETNDKIIEEAYSSSFYNDGFQTLSDIANNNKDNPEKLDIESMAYIDGVSINIPEEEREKIIKPFITVKNSYVAQARNNFSNITLKNSDEKAQQNTFIAKDLAIEATNQKAPKEVQASFLSSLFDNIRSDVHAGRYHANLGLSLIEEVGKNQIVNSIVDIFDDQEISYDQKIKLISDIAKGETGDEFIDFKLTPIERLEAINTALGHKKQMDALDQQKEVERAELFNEDLIKAKKDIAIYGASPEKMAQYERALYLKAKTDEEFNAVRNLSNYTFPTTTAPSTTRLVQRLKNDGKWNIDRFDYMISKNMFSASDVVKYGDELNRPEKLNMDLIPHVLSEARYRTKYGEQNQADYNLFLSKLLSNKEFTEAPVSQQKAEALARLALNETMKELPVTSQQKTEEFSKRTTEGGLPYEDMQDVIVSAKERAINKTNKKEKDLTYEDMRPFLREELKKKFDYRKKKGLTYEIRGANNELITDEDLIIRLQMALVKKEIEDGQ